MIHTASLVHDDVLDDCSVRRGARPAQFGCQLVRGPPTRCVGLTRQRGCAGKTTVNSLYGSRVAVLVGDYLFAQSSWYLANLDNLEVRAHSVQGYDNALCISCLLSVTVPGAGYQAHQPGHCRLCERRDQPGGLAV